MATLSFRIDLAPGGRIGPGKIALLEAIERTGSISAAGRALGMSYRRAWDLVDALNVALGGPVVITRHGGPQGGGAELTRFGREIVGHYRAIAQKAADAAAPHLAALETLAADRPPEA